MRSLVHVTVTPEDLARHFGDEPWPDVVVEGLIRCFNTNEALGRSFAYGAPFAWQVAIRVRRQQPIPPALQYWYNLYTAMGCRVPKRAPERRQRDRAEVTIHRALFGMSQAEAVRHVADITDRDPKVVETNLYR